MIFEFPDRNWPIAYVPLTAPRPSLGPLTFEMVRTIIEHCHTTSKISHYVFYRICYYRQAKH